MVLRATTRSQGIWYVVLQGCAKTVNKQQIASFTLLWKKCARTFALTGTSWRLYHHQHQRQSVAVAMCFRKRKKCVTIKLGLTALGASLSNGVRPVFVHHGGRGDTWPRDVDSGERSVPGGENVRTPAPGAAHIPQQVLAIRFCLCCRCAPCFGHWHRWRWRCRSAKSHTSFDTHRVNYAAPPNKERG